MVWFSTKRIIILFLFPTLLVYLTYIIIPVFIAFNYSFTQFSGIGVPKYIGLGNYAYLIDDPLFWISLKNTMIILLISFFVLLPGGFLMALMFNAKIKGSNVIKALNFAPAIVAPIVIGLIWVFILDPKIGLINGLLTKLGLGHYAIQWIGGGVNDPYSIGIVFSWQLIGFVATIFLAGLKMIPQDIYESSSIDGANKRQQLIYITLPLLKETFNIIVLLIITHCLKIFEIVLQLTNGGPSHLSEVLITYMYNVTFGESEYGYGMAIAVITTLLIVILSLIYLMISRRKSYKEGR